MYNGGIDSMGMAKVTRLPLQSRLYKRNALSVLITELQANGNGRQVMRPPPQSELRKRNTLCVQDGSAGGRQWQTGHAASSAK